MPSSEPQALLCSLPEPRSPRFFSLSCDGSWAGRMERSQVTTTHTYTCSCPKCSPAERRHCATVSLGPPGLWQDLDVQCPVPGLHYILRNHSGHCSEKSSRAFVCKDPTGQGQKPQTEQLSHTKTAAALRICIIIAVGIRKLLYKLDWQQVEDFRLRDLDLGPTSLY